MDMQIEKDGPRTCVELIGILKKDDARQVSSALEEIPATGCTELVINCTNLAAISYDSVGYLVSTLERLKNRRVKCIVRGANPVALKALQAGGLGRVARLE